MSWYKKAKKEFENYWEIGHNQNNMILWVYRNGKLLTHPAIKGDTAHLDVWPDITDDNYRGRFDINNKYTSLFNPYEGRPIPNSILGLLYDKFGNDIEIMEFN